MDTLIIVFDCTNQQSYDSLDVWYNQSKIRIILLLVVIKQTLNFIELIVLNILTSVPNRIIILKNLIIQNLLGANTEFIEYPI